MMLNYSKTYSLESMLPYCKLAKTEYGWQREFE